MYKPKLPPNFEILIVDDDKICCLLHKNLLKDANTEQPPVIFRNAKRALEYVESRNSHRNCFLIFLDLNMPLFNGWDFLNRLNSSKLNCHIHIVLATSSIQKKDEVTSTRFEKVIGFCRKPLKAEHIQKVKKLKEISGYFTSGKIFPKASESLEFSPEASE